MSLDKKGEDSTTSPSSETNSRQLNIPIILLTDRSLSVFEVLVEYLKEEQKLTLHEIAVLTNRDDRTIWTVYHRAKVKRETTPKPLLKPTSVNVPLSVLLDRTYAVLEAVSVYLKERSGFSYHEIAVMTGRDDRTIWTAYNRAKKKERGGGK